MMVTVIPSSKRKEDEHRNDSSQSSIDRERWMSEAKSRRTNRDEQFLTTVQTFMQRFTSSDESES